MPTCVAGAGGEGVGASVGARTGTGTMAVIITDWTAGGASAEPVRTPALARSIASSMPPVRGDADLGFRIYGLG